MTSESAAAKELREIIKLFFATDTKARRQVENAATLLERTQPSSAELTAARSASAQEIARLMEERDQLQVALGDLLTGIDVHNSRLSGKVEQPIEGPVVKAARDAWHAVRLRALRGRQPL